MRRLKIMIRRYRLPLLLILLLLLLAIVTTISMLLVFREAEIGFPSKGVTVSYGGSAQLKLQYKPSNRIHPKVTFTSSNPTVATVDEEGMVHALRGGITKIKATTRKGQEVTCQVQVPSPKEGKNIYLTFDGGPGTDVTPALLDVLKKYNAKATFFPEAQNIPVTEEILKREASEGHTIGVQSYIAELDTIYQSKDSYLDDFSRAEKVIRDVSGVQPTYWRFLGGSDNDYLSASMKRSIVDKLHSKGYTEMDWNAYTDDGSGQDLTVEEMVETAIRKIDIAIQAGVAPVVMVHDDNNKTKTAEVVEDILQHYQAKGYAFKGLDSYKGAEISLGSLR